MGGGGLPEVAGLPGEEPPGGSGGDLPGRLRGGSSRVGVPGEPAGGGPGAGSPWRAAGQATPDDGFRGSQPSPGAGLGEGEPVEPRVGLRSGAGAAALAESERGFGPSASGGPGAPGAPGMMAGRSGSDEADGEHTNKYVRGDPRALFVGELPLVAPRAIGQPSPPPPPREDG